VNIGGYGAIEDGLYAWFLKHDYDHYDYELVSKFGQGAAAAPGVVTGAQNIFYDTLRVVEDNKYGYQFNGTGGGSGADLPIEEPPVSSGNGTNAGVWVKARGSWTERDTSVEENGLVYDTSSSQDIYSILGGADMKPWGEDSPLRAGLFGGYVTSTLDFDVGSPEADYEGGVVGGYIAYNNGAFYADATVKGDLLNTTYSFGGQEADADVTSIGGSLNTGYRMQMGPGFIEPIASLEFVHSSVDDFNNAGTSVDFSNGQSIRGGVGAKIGTNFGTAGGTTTELSLLGKVWNEFEDANTVTLTQGMNTASFSDDISGVFGEVAATATIVSADGTSSGFISAGGQFGEDFMSLRAEAGLRKGF
jgi:outer membrane autotransporter protein